MITEHLFAPYIRILGKGKRGSRGLTQAEAYLSMQMILQGDVEPCQLGAFLMLLRVKEETSEEIAGFVNAIKASLEVPSTLPHIDLDWSSYAGKRRQLPWYILSALLLADHGYKVFMHGTEGHTQGRLYTRETLAALGIAESTSLKAAVNKLATNNFAYLSLEFLSPTIHEIINMRPLLGLRSPVHTIARMLNPLQAKHEIVGIFHPTYSDIHQQAALLLDRPHMAVLKGEGGEVERNPDSPVIVKSVHEKVLTQEEWPPMFDGPRHLKDTEMDILQLKLLWNGSNKNEYGLASITGTTAIILKLMNPELSQNESQNMANKLWATRNKEKFN